VGGSKELTVATIISIKPQVCCMEGTYSTAIATENIKMSLINMHMSNLSQAEKTNLKLLLLYI